MKRRFRFVVLVFLISTVAIPAWGNELRISTLGNQTLALDDEDGRLNPFDFGRNPAYLMLDFEFPWMRFVAGVEEQYGELKRPYDPRLVNDSYLGFTGIEKLGENHIAQGRFDYVRSWHKGLYRDLEIDHYNDPFYLTDETTGDFEYFGPSMSVDYAYRINPDLYLGAGFDYDISTGLKDRYTRPEIVHNYIMGNLGLLYKAGESLFFGAIARPVRVQNRTKFEKTDEGFDNVIYSYYGDGIYEIRAVSGYTIYEILYGVEVGLQSFYMTDRLQVGANLDYGLDQNELKYNATRKDLKGLWQNTSYDLDVRARYSPEGAPVIVGLRGRYLYEDGWAKRPDYDDVLLFENPVSLISAGGGVSYGFREAGIVVSAEYMMNMYDIEASDYGANSFRKTDVIQNIGRLGLEYNISNVYSFRGGVEVTDYLVERWLKLPGNTDRYRFTGGLEYHYSWWQLELELMYSRDSHENLDETRRGLSGMIWVTRLIH
jgi:hypothetical protein